MLTITQEQFEEWKSAILSAQFSSSLPLKQFKDKYPDLYRHMMSMLNKRTKITNTLKAFMSISPFVYWGALTYNEEEDKKDVKTKRKQALRFLDKYFKLYLFVEELGEDKERWHIHFLGILKDANTTYEEMYQSWHSRVKIECFYKYYDVKKKIKYVTKYAVKQVPRIHMNKRAVKFCKDYKLFKHNEKIGFSCFNKGYIDKIGDLLDLPF